MVDPSATGPRQLVPRPGGGQGTGSYSWNNVKTVTELKVLSSHQREDKSARINNEAPNNLKEYPNLLPRPTVMQATKRGFEQMQLPGEGGGPSQKKSKLDNGQSQESMSNTPTSLLAEPPDTTEPCHPSIQCASYALEMLHEASRISQGAVCLLILGQYFVLYTCR